MTVYVTSIVIRGSVHASVDGVYSNLESAFRSFCQHCVLNVRQVIWTLEFLDTTAHDTDANIRWSTVVAEDEIGYIEPFELDDPI